MTDDGILMRLALDEASAAADRGDPGFGAVLARAGQTVAQASSTEVTHRNPLAHDGQSEAGLAILARSLTDHPSEHG